MFGPKTSETTSVNFSIRKDDELVLDFALQNFKIDAPVAELALFGFSTLDFLAPTRYYLVNLYCEE